jgi:hypothetical protein
MQEKSVELRDVTRTLRYALVIELAKAIALLSVLCIL